MPNIWASLNVPFIHFLLQFFPNSKLGAKAVLLGRPILWGLAVAGEEGVAHVLQLLRDEIDISMALCGCRGIQDIEPSLLVQPYNGYGNDSCIK
jgi:hypothetical protein